MRCWLRTPRSPVKVCRADWGAKMSNTHFCSVWLDANPQATDDRSRVVLIANQQVSASVPRAYFWQHTYSCIEKQALTYNQQDHHQASLQIDFLDTMSMACYMVLSAAF